MSETQKPKGPVERPVRPERCCAQCAYWKRLVKTRDSWGICNVKVQDLQVPDPMRRILEPYRDMFGSVSPDGGENCECFTQFIATA